MYEFPGRNHQALPVQQRELQCCRQILGVSPALTAGLQLKPAENFTYPHVSSMLLQAQKFSLAKKSASLHIKKGRWEVTW